MDLLSDRVMKRAWKTADDSVCWNKNQQTLPSPSLLQTFLLVLQRNLDKISVQRPLHLAKYIGLIRNSNTTLDKQQVPLEA